MFGTPGGKPGSKPLLETIGPSREIPPIPIVSERMVTDRLYLRPREVAEMTGLSQSEVFKSIYAGELRALKYKSRVWLIPREAISQWIDAQTSPAA